MERRILKNPLYAFPFLARSHTRSRTFTRTRTRLLPVLTNKTILFQTSGTGRWSFLLIEDRELELYNPRGPGWDI